MARRAMALLAESCVGGCCRGNVKHGGINVLEMRSGGDVKLSSVQHVVGRS